MDHDDGLDRILTAPNVITVVRLLCIPLFLWLLFDQHSQALAAVLLAALGATDWIDGYVARRWHQVSTLGKVLDPTADRVLVATSVISVTIYGAVPLWFGLATIAREVLVSAMVILLAALGAGADRRVVGRQGRNVRLDVRVSGLPPRRRFRRVAGTGPGHRLGDRADRSHARVVGGGKLCDAGPTGVPRRARGRRSAV